jgi:hypothetical protein
MLTEAQKKQFAELSKEHLTKIYRTGRPYLTRLAQPPQEWFAQLAERKANDGEWFKRLEGTGAQPFTDAEALAFVRQDRRYAAGLKFRTETHLVGISHAIKPDVLAEHQRFFRELDKALAPPKGKSSEWDPQQILRLYEARLQHLIELQAEYRRTGMLSPVEAFAEALAVFKRITIVDGERHIDVVTIERETWPTEATWEYLEHFLAPTSRRTLERLLTAARRRR